MNDISIEFDNAALDLIDKWGIIPEDIPRLTAYIRRLRAEVEQLRAELARLTDARAEAEYDVSSGHITSATY